MEKKRYSSVVLRFLTVTSHDRELIRRSINEEGSQGIAPGWEETEEPEQKLPGLSPQIGRINKSAGTPCRGL